MWIGIDFFFLVSVSCPVLPSACCATFLATDSEDKGNSSLKFPFSMSGDGNDNLMIPSVFVEAEVGHLLIDLIDEGKEVKVLLTWPTEDFINQWKSDAKHKEPQPPTPIGPTQPPSVTENQPLKPTRERDRTEESVNNAPPPSDNRRTLPLEDKEDEVAGCSASDDGLFDNGERDLNDDVHR